MTAMTIGSGYHLGVDVVFFGENEGQTIEEQTYRFQLVDLSSS